MNQPALHVVENGESGLGRPLPVKLSRIERYPDQPRRYFPKQSIEELADSIQERKQDTPVKVCKHSSRPGIFVLIGGERRWRAFHLIQERTGVEPLVDCFIDLVHDEKHHFKKAFFDNIQHEDLIPADEAAAYHRLYTESELASHNAKVVEIAHAVKKSKTHIENYLAMHSLPDAVKRLLDPERERDDRLATTSAVEIARSTNDPTLQLSLAQEAIERNLGLVEVRTLIGIKTGRTGYGIGGRMRHPKDDYRMFVTYLARTRKGSENFRNNIDVGTLYEHRDDVRTDRARDSKTVKFIIEDLTEILKKIESGE